MSKHEWKKKEKDLYLPKKNPELINVPSFQFAVIEGEGNPNSEAFSQCVAALFAFSYTLKMGLKKYEDKPANYMDYAVYPLEGIWDLNKEARENYDGSFNKDDLVFKLMIRQPEFVSNELFNEFLELTRSKKAIPMLEKIFLQNIEDGKCVQMMHIGPYDDEPASFERMELFCKDEGISRTHKSHREIYISDFRKTAPEKLKTVLRFKVN